MPLIRRKLWTPSRRKVLIGAASLIASPAIVRAGWLPLVKAGGGGGTAPVLDGIAYGQNHTTTSVSNGLYPLVTTVATDVIVAILMTTNQSGGGLPPNGSSIGGTSGDINGLSFTFNSRQNITPGSASSINIEFWSAAATGIYTTGVVSATCGTSFDTGEIILMGWSGCGTPSSPWDANGSLPAGSSNAGTTAPTVTGISTTSPGTVVLTACGAANASSSYTDQTAGGSATLLTNVPYVGGSDYSKLAAEYQAFTAAQSSVTQSFGVSWLNWNAISHALVGT